MNMVMANAIKTQTLESFGFPADDARNLRLFGDTLAGMISRGCMIAACGWVRDKPIADAMRDRMGSIGSFTAFDGHRFMDENVPEAFSIWLRGFLTGVARMTYIALARAEALSPEQLKALLTDEGARHGCNRYH